MATKAAKKPKQRRNKNGNGADIPDSYRSILVGIKSERVQFILNLVNPRNKSIGTAYAKAYPGCKMNTAFANGSRLLQNAEISGAVEKIRALIVDRVTKKLEVTEEKLVAEMAKIAYVDAGDIGTWDKNTLILNSSEELPPELTAAIESVRRVETAEGVRVEVKFHDKKGALDSLFRYKGLFEKDMEQLGAAIGKAIIVTAKQSIVPDP